MHVVACVAQSVQGLSRTEGPEQGPETPVRARRADRERREKGLADGGWRAATTAQAGDKGTGLMGQKQGPVAPAPVDDAVQSRRNGDEPRNDPDRRSLHRVAEVVPYDSSPWWP